MEDVVGSAFQLVHFFGHVVAHYISLIEDDVGVLAHFIFFLDQLQTTGASCGFCWLGRSSAASLIG